MILIFRLSESPVLAWRCQDKVLLFRKENRHGINECNSIFQSFLNIDQNYYNKNFVMTAFVTLDYGDIFIKIDIEQTEHRRRKLREHRAK